MRSAIASPADAGRAAPPEAVRRSIVRPGWWARHRAYIAGACVAGALVAVHVTERSSTLVIVPVIVPSAPVEPAPAVEPVPSVEPVPAEPEPPPELRTLAPDLTASCAVRGLFEEIDYAACAASDGFPAISRDGATIVALYAPGDGALHVRFVDVASETVIRDLPLRTTAEVSAELTPSVAARATIHRRIAAATTYLAGYRALVEIVDRPPDVERPAGLHRVLDLDHPQLIQVVDDTARAVLWPERFAAEERGYPARTLPEEYGPDCYPNLTRSIRTWWEPGSRTLLAEVTYVGWACDCPTWGVHHHVRRLPVP